MFWFAYMLSVFAGLMAIGHAAGIALSKGASHDISVWCAMVIGIGSAVAGFLAGWLVDKWPVARFLIGLPLLSAAALFMLAFSQTPLLVMALLGLVGFSYGAVIAIYPVAIADEFGDLGPKAYGRVFTAWGFAGLVAPWSAGYIYDLNLNYQMALIVAACDSIIVGVCCNLWSIRTARNIIFSLRRGERRENITRFLSAFVRTRKNIHAETRGTQ